MQSIGDIKEIVDEGMPIWKRPFDKGLLIIKFDVKFPDFISPDNAKVYLILILILYIYIYIYYF